MVHLKSFQNTDFSKTNQKVLEDNLSGHCPSQATEPFNNMVQKILGYGAKIWSALL